ncbi:unnamed protein product [Didymodactylos carnosus]|uniref:Uncharacterized protein n=1 Tax=Didymodactylos carnosus TaxID=1234261 RepID=A0A8S2MNA8_9BILA|nr:unnamed protein product [Didymodactylos carnosus]CAF3951939.1 unnamed protein product [Didymodactylos carnosus]
MLCSWKGSRNDLSAHLTTCPYNAIRPTLTKLMGENKQLKEEIAQMDRIQTENNYQLNNGIEQLRGGYGQLMEQVSALQIENQIANEEVSHLKYMLANIQQPKPTHDNMRKERVGFNKLGSNKDPSDSQRPYFEGHERDDVVKHRNEFIGYFLAHKDYYYTITDGEIPMWIIPIQNPHRILIFHDESTFRSGEVSPKRWFFGENTPFFSKGRGLSHMISDFLVQHPSGPFFELSSIL